MVPCYNEVENAELMANSIRNVIKEALSSYDYEIVFIDNHSTDGTREVIRNLCSHDSKIKAIFNVTDFGQFNSPFYGICQCSGDCVIPICCDFQDPVELIPEFVKCWEQGHKVVVGVKTSSRENPILYFLRTIYYRLIMKMSSVKMIEHFTGFGLYDKSFVELIRQLDDPVPFLRGIVAEYGFGFNMKKYEYTQARRRAGKTHNNFYTLYDAAMLSFTSYTKTGLRIATFLGLICSGISFFVALFYFIRKLVDWENFALGSAPVTVGVFFLGGIQLLFLGLLGEYVLNINTRVINRPVVIEEERINFCRDDIFETSAGRMRTGKNKDKDSV